METLRQLGLPVDAIYQDIKVGIQSIIVFVGVFGNLYTIFCVLRKSKLPKVTNAFIIALSLGLILQALNASIDYTNHWANRGHYIWSHMACDFWLTLNVYLPSMLSFLCFFAILDRYILLTRPSTYTKVLSGMKATAMIGFSYIYPALVSVPPIYFNWHTYDEYVRNRPGGECKFKINMSYALISPLVTFWFPLVLDAIIIIKLFKAMEQHDRWLATIVRSRSLIRTEKSVEMAKDEALLKLPWAEDQIRRQHRLAITLWSVYWNVSIFWMPQHVWQAIYKVTDADWPRATNFMPWFGYIPCAILPGLFLYYDIYDI